MFCAPSTNGAGCKTRLGSRIKPFNPHSVYAWFHRPGLLRMGGEQVRRQLSTRDTQTPFGVEGHWAPATPYRCLWSRGQLGTRNRRCWSRGQLSTRDFVKGRGGPHKCRHKERYTAVPAPGATTHTSTLSQSPATVAQLTGREREREKRKTHTHGLFSKGIFLSSCSRLERTVVANKNNTGCASRVVLCWSGMPRSITRSW